MAINAAQNPLDQIRAQFADESWRSRNSAIVFAAVGALVQIALAAFLGLPKTAGEIVNFAVAGALFAGIFWLAAIYYVVQWRRKAARATNNLYRALTSEPSLIKEIVVVTPRAETVEARQAEYQDRSRRDLIGNILDGIFNTNATPDFRVEALGDQSPKLFVRIRLSDDAEHPIFCALAAEEIVAALKQHHARARIVESNV